MAPFPYTHEFHPYQPCAIRFSFILLNNLASLSDYNLSTEIGALYRSAAGPAPAFGGDLKPERTKAHNDDYCQ
jgi:hypothetical protein